jgi:hypothetical protein
MRPDEQDRQDGIEPRGRRGLSLALFYFEQVGPRSYLRITKLGVILILLFATLPVVALIGIYLWNSSTPPPDVDVTIKPMPAASALPSPVIKQAPPPPTPPKAPR